MRINLLVHCLNQNYRFKNDNPKEASRLDAVEMFLFLSERVFFSFFLFCGILEDDLQQCKQNKIESNHKGESEKAENESTLNPSYLFRSCERRNCDELKCLTLLLCEL